MLIIFENFSYFLCRNERVVGNTCRLGSVSFLLAAFLEPVLRRFFGAQVQRGIRSARFLEIPNAGEISFRSFLRYARTKSSTFCLRTTSGRPAHRIRSKKYWLSPPLIRNSRRRTKLMSRVPVPRTERDRTSTNIDRCRYFLRQDIRLRQAVFDRASGEAIIKNKNTYG